MDDYTDAWFVGFDPNITVGVWVGYDEKKPIGNGETGARRRAADLDRLHAAPTSTPAATARIRRHSRRPATSCSSPSIAGPASLAGDGVPAITEAFIAGTQPSTLPPP